MWQVGWYNEAGQSVDKAAYLKDYSTEEHVLSTTLLVEKCSEWNQELWLGLVDFEKASDSVEHAPLWHALSTLGVEEPYVDLLNTLYKKQSATVVAGAESWQFDIQQGVKQVDPISSLLFIAVMEMTVRTLKERCQGRYYGI